MLLSYHLHISESIYTLQLPECQETPCSEQARYLDFLSDSNGIRTYNHLVSKEKCSFTN